MALIGCKSFLLLWGSVMSLDEVSDEIKKLAEKHGVDKEDIIWTLGYKGVDRRVKTRRYVDRDTAELGV